MAALVLSSACSTVIRDAQFCSPLPGGIGATCDNFTSKNQQILNAAQWTALQAQWMSAGRAVECTTSETLGDFKMEIEKLCSRSPCDYEAEPAAKGTP